MAGKHTRFIFVRGRGRINGNKISSHHCSWQTRPLHGFTLIELLVVVAIIALLVSILLPSLKTAKDLAERTSCAMQMHTMQLANILYAGDSNEWMPERSIWYSYKLYEIRAGGVEYESFNLFRPFATGYLEQWQALECPSMPEPTTSLEAKVKAWLDGATRYHDFFGYWYLQDAARYFEAVEKAEEYGFRIKHDGSCWQYSMTGLSHYPIITDFAWGYYGTTTGFPHGEEGLNVAYGDGHVAWVDSPNLYDIIESYGSDDYGITGVKELWKELAK